MRIEKTRIRGNTTGTLNGGGSIYRASYTTSGSGKLTAPNLVASPEPGSAALLVVGLAVIGPSSALGVSRKQIGSQQALHFLDYFAALVRIGLLISERNQAFTDLIRNR
jgi:hypothetical protein